jgi:plastocyanin
MKNLPTIRVCLRDAPLWLASLLALAGCIGEPVPTPTLTASAADGVTIEIRLFTFPDVVEIPIGTAVTWINQDGIRHSVSHGTPDSPGAVFDSGFFTRGESFSFTFLEPGDFPYFCMRHNHMQGIIRVVEAP